LESISPSERDKLRGKATGGGLIVPEPGADPASLSKAEERALRSALRKIRNVASAKKSRLNQKDYIITLERDAAKHKKEKEATISTIQQLQGTVESLVEKNDSLFAQLRALKARIKDSRGSISTFSMLTLWMGVGLTFDVVYWDEKLTSWKEELALTAVGGEEGGAGTVKGEPDNGINHSFHSRTLKNFENEDLEQGLSASMFNWRLQLASLDTRSRILDALQDGETNPDAVPQRTSGWYMPLTTQLTVHQKCMVSRLPSMLDEDSEVILGIVFFLIFWAVCAKLVLNFCSTCKGRVWPTLVRSLLCIIFAVDVAEASGWINMWLSKACQAEATSE